MLEPGHRRNLRGYVPCQVEVGDGPLSPLPAARLRSGHGLTLFVGYARPAVFLHCPTGFIRSRGMLQTATVGPGRAVERTWHPGGVPGPARERWLTLAQAARTESGAT